MSGSGSHRGRTRGGPASGLAALAFIAGMAGQVQAQTFQRTVGHPFDERGMCVEQTGDGGYVTVGSSDSGGNWNVMLHKVDAFGNTQLDIEYDGPNLAIEIGEHVEQLPDGGYAISGQSFLANGFGTLFFRTDAAGNVLWSRILPGTAGSGPEGSHFTSTSDGGFVICSRLQGNAWAQQGGVLVKLSAAGAVVWSHIYHDTRFQGNTFCVFNDVEENTDGTLAVTGYVADTSQGNRNVFLLKLTPAGVPIWSFDYGLDGFADIGKALEISSNNDYLLDMYCKCIGEGGGTMVMRTNPAGAPIWVRTFRGFNSAGSIEERPNNDIVLAGEAMNDASIMLLDAGGTFQWCWRYGGTTTDYAEWCVPTNDNGFFTLGWTQSFGMGSNDFYLLKADSTGSTGCNEQLFNPDLGVVQLPFEPIIFRAQQIEPGTFYQLTLLDPLHTNRVLCEDLGDPCFPPPLGMVGWWTFDEPVPASAMDSALNNDGTHVNGPTPIAAGADQGALCFDGVNDFVHVPNHPSLNFGTGDLSIDAWVRVNAADAAGVRVIVDKRTQTPAGTRGYSFYLSNGVLGFQLADRNGSNVCSPLPAASCTNWAGGPSVATGTWRHVAVTVDRNSVTGGRFYVDGALVFTFDPTVRPLSISNNSPLRIGVRSFSPSAQLRGCLDEVEVFRRVLTPAEISSIFLRTKCKETCSVPWDRPFCRTASSIVVGMTLCNNSPVAQTYQVSFSPIPAFTPPFNCPINGPTVFTVLTPNPVVIPANSCTVFNVQIQRPPGLNVGTVACYTAHFTNMDTGEVVHCHGSVMGTGQYCPRIIDDFVTVLEVGQPMRFDFLFDPIDEPETLPIRISAMPSDMEEMEAQAISLNGLPPGEPVIGTLVFMPGEVPRASVVAMFTEHQPFEVHTILIEADLDGNGVMEPLTSSALRSGDLPTCPADWDGNGVVNAADVGAFLTDYFLDVANLTQVTDLDLNGVVNAVDVGVFLNIYFTPCPE